MKAANLRVWLFFQLLIMLIAGCFTSCLVAAEIRMFETVKPIPVYQAAIMGTNNFGFATYLEPNTPCALIATHFNGAESPNYTYHNPRGYVHPSWGLGCAFDMYIRRSWAGWAEGTVRDDYRQNWVLATHICPQGYSMNAAGLCQLAVPSSEPVCYGNPILLGDGSKYQVLNFGGTSFGRIGFKLAYRSKPYFRKGEKYRSMYGQLNWSDNSDQRLLFSRVDDGRFNIYFHEGPSALYIFEVDGNTVVSRNDASKNLKNVNGEWILMDYKKDQEMHFNAAGLLYSFGRIGDGDMTKIGRFEKDLTYQTAIPLGRAESWRGRFDDVIYEYGSNGHVSKVRSKSGEYLRFIYNNVHLVEVIFLATNFRQIQKRLLCISLNTAKIAFLC